MNTETKVHEYHLRTSNRACGQTAQEIYTRGYNAGKSDAIKELEQKPRIGEWLRMSDLSEQEDDRYKCSHCGNVVHYKDKMNLYTFNSWCGRCGSNNGTKQGLAYANQETMMPVT